MIQRGDERDEHPLLQAGGARDTPLGDLGAPLGAPLRIPRRAAALVWHTVTLRGPGPDLRENARRLRHTAERLARAHGLQIERTGVLPRGPAVLVANHISYLDPIALGQALPCAPIAKREVFEWPLIGPAMRTLGCIAVDRGDASSGARALRKARLCLAAGVPVLAFPEGTTTLGDRVLPFHRGLFGLAARLGIPVVPLGLRYGHPGVAWVDDMGFAWHYLGVAARPRIAVRLRVGAPMCALPGEAATDFAERARQKVVELSGPETLFCDT